MCARLVLNHRGLLPAPICLHFIRVGSTGLFTLAQVFFSPPSERGDKQVVPG